MPCPTSFTITGIFGLSHGKRLEFGKPNTASYLSAIDFIDPELGLNVSLRKYTPADEDLYEERALVFISAKAVLPIGKDGMLDIIYCAPVLFLREILPLGSTHIASVAGVVGAAGPGAPDRSFTLSGMNHVFGGAHQFIISSCQFDGGSSRWENTPPPPVGKSAVVSGLFKALEEGMCIIQITNITFEPPEKAASLSTRSRGYRRTPANLQPSSPPAPSDAGTGGVPTTHWARHHASQEYTYENIPSTPTSSWRSGADDEPVASTSQSPAHGKRPREGEMGQVFLPPTKRRNGLVKKP